MDEGYSGFIIVRLAPVSPPQEDVDISDLATLARKHQLGELSGMLDTYAQCTTSRLLSSVSARQTLELEKKATQLGSKPRRSLSSYWRIDAREVPDPEELVRSLNQLSFVELAYREVRGKNPQGPPQANPFARHQFHLDPAPVGIDARFAHSHLHGRGASVGFVDLEQGWFFDHEDLPVIRALAGVSHDTVDTSRHHGTGVLGIAVGMDNTRGIIGVAPAPEWVSVTSHFRNALGADRVAEAIDAVLPHMDAGDVLLIEWQDFFNRPAEVDPAIQDEIQKACALGVIVVEAAGNGDTDLDTIAAMNPSSPGFEDSEAIIVGACHSALDSSRAAHDRWLHPRYPAGSNFGARVDCHAFGEHVVTAGPALFPGRLVGDGNLPTNQYRRDFGGTSAAAAIVAGVAVALQSMHKGVKGRALSSIEMRNVFRNHGTPQGARPGHIGRMPDLREIARVLGL